MDFEFFFGLFGLISSGSKSRHKSPLDGDWRLFNPLGASLLRSSDQKSSASSGNSPTSFKSWSNANLQQQQQQQQQPIFSTTGTLGTANNSGFFSSTSSSSASSIASSGSASTVGSTSTLIKTDDLGEMNKSGTDSPILYDPSKLEKEGFSMTSEEKASKTGADSSTNEPDSLTNAPSGSRSRRIYCRVVCLFLWFQVMRLLAGLIIERSIVTLDFYYLGTYRIHFLIPALCLAIQAAAVSLIFIRNNDETNWLVPFYSSKDYLIRSRSNFRPKIEDYGRRVNVSATMGLILAMTSSISVSAYLIHCVMKAESMQTFANWGGSSSAVADEAAAAATATAAYLNKSASELAKLRLERTVLSLLVVYDILWAFYSAYICFLVSFYFNLICSIMKARFHGISMIIEDLTESNTTKTINQARKITTLYLEHNEACELLDESNDFWQYLIFFTYLTYIPAYCYCLYNLFFVDFEAWPSFIIWVIHTHTGFIILLISFSAAGVSTEAHAPYTSLHTLSLIQLPLDVEVNIATFLHRVRGLTIGYSCYDLFAITNGSMSNTAAACASYFLIVADFNRSSVFTLAQMNNTAATAAASAAGALSTVAPAAG